MNAGQLKQAVCEVESALEGNEKASTAFERLKEVVKEYVDILEMSAQEQAEGLMDCLDYEGDGEEIRDELREMLASGDTEAFTRRVEALERKHGEDIANSERMDDLINHIGIQLAWNGDIAEHLASAMSPAREPGM